MTSSSVRPVPPELPEQEPVRTLRAVPPEQRPLRRRSTARVLLIDPQQCVLLFSDRDPAIDGPPWWMTPGGGVDAGESDLQAAVREVQEETGLVLDPSALIGPIAARRVWHGYSDVVIDQQDKFFAAYVDAFTVDVSGHTEQEKITMTASRWWSRGELSVTNETVWPVQLLDIWDRIEAFGRGDAALWTMPDADESTVLPGLGWVL